MHTHFAARMSICAALVALGWAGGCGRVDTSGLAGDAAAGPDSIAVRGGVDASTRADDAIATDVSARADGAPAADASLPSDATIAADAPAASDRTAAIDAAAADAGGDTGVPPGGCTRNADCRNGDVCVIATQTCARPCQGGNNCDGMICNPATLTCVECLTDADCDGGRRCLPDLTCGR